MTTTEETATTTHELTHVLVMTVAFPGYWGKGKTLSEAIENAKWISAGDRIRVIRVDEAARVDELGQLLFNNRKHLGAGKVKRVRKGNERFGVIDLQPEPGVES